MRAFAYLAAASVTALATVLLMNEGFKNSLGHGYTIGLLGAFLIVIFIFKAIVNAITSEE
jgi:hypothetical protein